MSKGMACDKKRRTSHHVEWRSWLEASPFIRGLVFLCYIAFAFACTVLYAVPKESEWLILIGIFLGCSLLLVKLDQTTVWQSNSKLLLLLGSISFNLFVNKALFVWSVFNQGQAAVPPLLFWIPVAFAPLLITVLLGTRAGLYTVMVASLLGALILDYSPTERFVLLVISVIVGFIGVLSSRNVRRRGDLIRSGVSIGLVSLFCAVTFGLLRGRDASFLWQQAMLAVGVGIATAVFVGAILPIIETVFNIPTNLSWIELADLNHPLLRELTLEAPGTYHHSLVVANLAEAAAISIGANGTLCRVMAYFHDIGKLVKPEYFVENMASGENPHDTLSPTMSSLIIISHVKEGVDLAVKHRLKQAIIDGIREHHGTSQVYYFYRRAVQLTEDAKAGSEILNLREDDIPDVPEENFRYPGPVPQSKETGLLMLADAAEGASRSLEKPTAQRIEDLVNNLVAERIASHQLDDSGLSLKELREASESFIFTLKTMLHSRISYPKPHEPSQPPSSSGSLQPARRVPGGDGEPRPAAPVGH